MAKQVIQGVEVHDDQPEIQTVAETKDFAKLVADEVFMNEPVTIEVAPSQNPDDAQNFVINVNGTNMPIPRGTPIVIKRKYVEVLARNKQTTYKQVTPNPSQPENTIMVPSTVFCYPFQLVEDKNPRGREWLRHVMAERA